MAGAAPLIVLFTDFGLEGPYTGQMKAVLRREAPAAELIDLFANAPAGDPYRSAYLLVAYARSFQASTVFLGVVDPGVGGARAPVFIEADECFYVGPENGLFELVLRRAQNARCYEILWRPPRLSASFHGRDLFAPVAAMLARGMRPESRERALHRYPDWPDELAEIVYIDHYGNAMTGMRAESLARGSVLQASQAQITPAQIRSAATFSAVPEGAAFWYENSNGLVEIAVNRGRADKLLGLAIGSRVSIVS